MKRKKKKKTALDIYKSVRKAPVPATKVINPKKKYDRKDKSWLEEKE